MMITSCATERVIYKTEYIKPDIIDLKILPRPALTEVSYERSGDLYCTSVDAYSAILNNEVSYQGIIKSYEEQIKVYKAFREENYSSIR